MVRIDGYQTVPCGKCTKCRQRRVNDWVFRLTNEDRLLNGGGLFVTLTYAPEHMHNNDSGCVRITPKGRKTVCKRDLQLFMKRLRKAHGKSRIKYYIAAEYGGKFKRPHYHALLFGANMELIDKAWGMGDVRIDPLNGATCAYSLKYICKEKQIPAYAGDDRVPEFSLSSTNIGLNYITPQMKKWHIENEASYFVKEGGYKSSLPRYYRERIFTQEQRDKIAQKTAQNNAEQVERNVMEAGGWTEYYHQIHARGVDDRRKLDRKNREETI